MKSLIYVGMLLLIGFVPLGCSAAKLNYENQFSLTLQTPEHVSFFDAQKQDQTLTVVVDCAEPVNLGFYAKSVADDPRDLSPADRSSKAIFHKLSVSSETFTVKIPGNTAYSLMVYLPADGKKPANPRVKITN